MTFQEILLVAILLLLLINIIATRFAKSGNSSGLKKELDRIDPLIRSEFSNSRDEIQRGAKASREEMGSLFKIFGESLIDNNNVSTAAQKTQLETFSGQLDVLTKSNEQRIDKLSNITEQRQKDFNEMLRQKFNDLSTKQEELKADTANKLDKIRETVEAKLQHLQMENSKKLDEMRNTVDEKLQSTLEKRFSESFNLISERLEQVQKGLGEMQGLVTNVGDLKKLMSNVKSRGVLGEYQLANILEDLLTNEQYEKNVKTKTGSGAIVEFAIKMPHGHNLEKTLWLPIDSKFPKEDYEALVEAYDTGEPVLIENLRKSFRQGMIKNARDIKDKYIDPPNTTEYGIMFLPFESLYAEVLRTPGLFELLQKEYKITVTGPTTLSALLNSLQMGFRTLAIEKRSGEVWDLLSAVKAEFSEFGTVLEKTKKKLQEATNTIDKAGVRSRAIERQLRKVQELPSQTTMEKMEEAIALDSQHISDEVDELTDRSDGTPGLL